ncbi:MAG: sigma-54 dependent transcriptional regulator [Usitatibacteraceae bacterium]
MSKSVLIVEDDEILANNIRLYLERDQWEVSVSSSVEKALSMLETLRPDVVVTDYMLPGKNGLDLLREVIAMDPYIKVVMVTGEGSIQVAVDAIRLGAHDYVGKPVVLAELKLLLERALAAVRVEKTLSFYKSNQARGSGVEALLGESQPIRRLKDTIYQIIETESRITDGELPTVLITGETGTGKELVARALHFDGLRREGPFVEVNCASIPYTLMETELFGHERGAFSDAKERKMGLVEAAEGGTLFLDEIGEVDFAMQAKLLKLLEERMVRRIGSVRERKVNVRIVAATNQDLQKMVSEGRFRADLYFRLRIISLHIPPLRERDKDVLLLARYFLAFYGRRYGKKDLEFAPKAEALLLEHTWPGNVRELRNALDQTVLLTRERIIDPESLAIYAAPRVDRDIASGTQTSAGIAAQNQGATLNEVEREMVLQTLERTDWNVSKAARILGLSRDMLRTRMEKYGLARADK